MTDNKPEGQFRSGFISIIGRPNVGKSTLLNRILGEKIVITSDKPQTTRNRIQGIHNVPNGQMIFIDTPGIHKAESRFNKNMVDTALASIKEVDVILFLVDPTEKIGEVDLSILQALKNAEAPVILVLNKVDVAGQSLHTVKEKLTGLLSFHDVVEVSALRGKGVDDLVAKVFDLLPEGPMYFPDDIITDVPERFVVAEIVREKVFRLTREEIPYSVAVVVESFKEREDGLVSIAATINVERDSQKGIIIGGKGAMLKKIGSDARRDIETFLQTRVFLELFVRVTKNWSENPRILKEFGYE